MTALKGLLVGLPPRAAISNFSVKWPQRQGAVVFGDITSARLFYARMADLVAATDGNPTALAPYAEITTTHPTLVQERIRLNPPAPGFGTGRTGGPGAAPADAAFAPRPLRVELRIATDAAGEIYIMTKSDGLIRRVMSMK